jgi:hypothetical protein
MWVALFEGRRIVGVKLLNPQVGQELTMLGNEGESKMVTPEAQREGRVTMEISKSDASTHQQTIGVRPAIPPLALDPPLPPFFCSSSSSNIATSEL